MSIISVFPGKGKAKLEAGSASPLTYAKTYTPSGDNEGFSSFKVNAIPESYIRPSYTQTAQEWTPTIRDQTLPAGTYCTGKQTFKGDANLIATNIKKGVSIFGVSGELELGLEIDSFTVSNSISTVPSEGDTFYNSLYIDAYLTPLVSKYSGITPYRIEIRQQTESMEYGAAIMSTEIVSMGEALTVSGLTISKDDERTAFWEVAPDYLKCYVGTGGITIYSTSISNQRKQFNGTYQVIMYYTKTS